MRSSRLVPAPTMVTTDAPVRKRPHWFTVSFQTTGSRMGTSGRPLSLVELMVQRSGYEFIEDDEVVADTITDVARGEMGYDDLAEWFRERLVRPGGQ